MNEKKDKWEQLTEIPQDYEVNPDLIKKAESAMRQERRTTRRNVHVWQTVAGSLAACCLLLIMIPAFRSLGNDPITPPDSSSSSTEERYFEAGSVEFREISNLTDIVEANDLKIQYYANNYADKSVQSSLGKIKDTGELAIISQSMFCFDTWDEVALMISLKPNDKFETFDSYETLSESILVSEVSIQYSIRDSAGSKKIKAKFVYEGFPYYLEIKTEDATGKIEKYVNMLISQQN